MKILKHPLSLIILCVLQLSIVAEAAEPAASLVDSLRTALTDLPGRREVLMGDLEALRHNRLNADAQKRLELNSMLANEYILVDIDSALIYMQMAYDDAVSLHDKRQKASIRLKTLSLMACMGIVKEAIDYFEAIDYSALPAYMRPAYWRAAAELFNSSQATYPEGRFRDEYKHRTVAALDSLIQYYPAESPIKPYLRGQISLLEGEYGMATANFLEAIPQLREHPELSLVAMREVADYYKGRPEYEDTYRHYLYHCALNTLSRGLIRPSILAETGEELIKSGEEGLGRKFIELAVGNRDNSYAGYYSHLDRSKYIHHITSDGRMLKHTRRVFAFTCIALVAMFVVIYFRLKRRLQELQSTARRLQDTIDHMSELAQATNKSVLNMAFLAMEQSKDFNVYVSRRIKAGQVKDLAYDINNGSYLERQNEKFFEEFDACFLSNFGDFVNKLNALLLPDKQLKLLPGGRMTPEMRIAAFLRLGVNDSSRLAMAMGLSLNTIYTYRNRLRGRAKDRDSFESDVAQIS